LPPREGPLTVEREDVDAAEGFFSERFEVEVERDGGMSFFGMSAGLRN